MYGLFLITYSGSHPQGSFESMEAAQAWIDARALELGEFDEEESYELDAPDGSLWYLSPADGWVQED